MEILYSILLAWCLAYSVSAQGTDLTLVPRQAGLDVVNAVNTKIEMSNIFPPAPKRFLPRWAYAESSFGEDDDTFPPTYYGGIWNVTDSMFQVTMNLANPTVFAYHMKILGEFGIMWSSLTWEDLQKPLHSAIALRFNLVLQNLEIPDTAMTQSVLWEAVYGTGSRNRDEFMAKVTELESRRVCLMSNFENIFILDGSGSIGSRDFLCGKTYISQLLGAVGDGLSNAVIVYDIALYGTQGVIFDLSDTFDAAVKRQKIMAVSYAGGLTPTAQAIDASTLMFSTKGKPGSNRVAYVFTDGQSNNPTATAQAAARARAAGIHMLAGAIGSGIGESELQAIASHPSSVVRLHDYCNSLPDSVYLIHELTCGVAAKPQIGATVSDSVTPQEYHYYQYNLPSTGITVDVRAKQGQVEAFYSHTFTTPSSAFNAGRITGPTVISAASGQQVFIAVKGGSAAVNTFDLFTS